MARLGGTRAGGDEGESDVADEVPPLAHGGSSSAAFMATLSGLLHWASRPAITVRSGSMPRRAPNDRGEPVWFGLALQGGDGQAFTRLARFYRQRGKLHGTASQRERCPHMVPDCARALAFRVTTLQWVWGKGVEARSSEVESGRVGSGRQVPQHRCVESRGGRER